MSTIKRLFLAVAALFIGVVPFAHDADATPIYLSGFFCVVEHTPNPYYGDGGMLAVMLTNQPDCQGGIAVNGVVYSVNASAPHANASYLYSEAQLMALYQNLQNAAASSQHGSLRIEANRGANNTILTVAFGGP